LNLAWIDLLYIFSSILFILGLKMLGKASTARKGNLVSSVGMAVAIIATLVHQNILSYQSIAIGILVGTAIGAWAAQRIQMTSMPEMIALFNGSGGIASLLVGWSEFRAGESFDAVTAIAIYAAVLIGGVTFTGSLVAYGKLSERMTSKAVVFAGQKVVNILVIALLLLGVGVFAVSGQLDHSIFLGILVLSLAFGVLSVLPIGGADMPVVISLLNSYSGIAASAAGFVIMNNVLIVAGSLVGASGIILTQLMCKSMNRSLSNVLYSGFSSAKTSEGQMFTGEARPISAEDAYMLLEAARSVLVVPGYGMAVAQAQHAVRELADQLERNGTEVRFAIHPVAGRMPGHMNVLLAEANVSYDQLVEPDDVNPSMETVDVTLVVGANDVVNPAARIDKTSPLYGMPIIDVDRAKVCIVLKRSMKPGFAGVDNPLFFNSGTRMLLGDAKASIAALVTEFKGS
jgi:NAD(P) transhydrogenase subunit beta